MTPIEVAIGYLTDMHRDLTTFEGEEEFAEGFAHALHNLKVIYIEYSGNFECDCPDARDGEVVMAEAYAGGVWGCGECGAMVTTDADLAEVGR